MWKKRLSRITVVIGLVWIGTVILLVVTVHTFGQQSDNQQTADVIIVLGSGVRRNGTPGDALYRRSVAGATAWQNGQAPYIICTGGTSEGQTKSEAQACSEVLRQRGVPADVIYLEDQSRSTEENALFSKRIMVEQGWQDAILITDSFHMFRADWIFDATGIAHYNQPVSSDLVRNRWYIQLLAREILALHWQAFTDLLNLPVTNFSLGS